MTRHEQRQLLRRIAEAAVLHTLGAVPRKFRRGAGRIYANSCYRLAHNLPTPAWHKYGRSVPHPAVQGWILDQAAAYVKPKSEPQL